MSKFELVVDYQQSESVAYSGLQWFINEPIAAYNDSLPLLQLPTMILYRAYSGLQWFITVPIAAYNDSLPYL